jgi:hypothetical protein
VAQSNTTTGKVKRTIKARSEKEKVITKVKIERRFFGPELGPLLLISRFDAFLLDR